MYLYFVREFGGDPDEHFSFARGDKIDLCFMMNSIVKSAKSSGRDARGNLSPSEIEKIKLDKLF